MGLVWVRQCKSCRANVSHVIEVPTPEELATIRAAYEKIGVTPTTSDKTDERFAEIDIGSMDLDVSYDMEGQALASSSSSSSSYSACVAVSEILSGPINAGCEFCQQKPLPPSIATVSINSFFDDNSMDMDSVYDLEVQALNSSLTVTSYVGYVAVSEPVPPSNPCWIEFLSVSADTCPRDSDRPTVCRSLPYSNCAVHEEDLQGHG